MTATARLIRQDEVGLIELDMIVGGEPVDAARARAIGLVDVDLVDVNGCGLPAWRGGPMCFADTVGLREVAGRVREFHATQGEWWTPGPLPLELAAAERRFSQGA